MFGYTGDTERISPFLLLDYAAPIRFEPTTHRRGVGQHAHRGVETVSTTARSSTVIPPARAA